MSTGGPTHTIAIIPARYGSKRLPGKPLAEIGGIPMIVHVMHRTAQAKLVDRVLVATDDPRIAAVVESNGGTAIMTPVEMRSGSDRIASVARKVNDGEIIINVQGDEPLIPPAMIDEAVRPMLDDRAIDVLTLVRPIHAIEELAAPSVTKVVLDRASNCLYFSRAPIPFGRDRTKEDLLRESVTYAHIGLYVYRRDFLIRYADMEETPLERAEKLEQLRILENGYKIRAVVSSYESIAVDTQEDLERVRALFRNHLTDRPPV